MRAHGIDVSKWQSYYRRVESPPRPVDFAIQRTSYGLKRDERLNEIWKEGVSKAPITGAYHYYSSAVDWKPQCDFFMELMDDKYDFWAWDIEKAYNVDPKTGQFSSSFLNGIPKAMEYITKATGKKGLCYFNPNTWGTLLVPIHAYLKKYDLWVAHYWWIRGNPESTPNYWTVRGSGAMTHDWRFWQYDDKGGGNRGKEYGAGSFGLDLDVFNGTVEDLWKWCKPSEGQPPVYPKCPSCGADLVGWTSPP